ncbi:hypothetical protein ATE84_0855 [Aquimarina sp. MAR_2010_214]|nr:hypothetical protein ATE84_0855 [Aquimarina sp. MAR_2010_214]
MEQCESEIKLRKLISAKPKGLHLLFPTPASRVKYYIIPNNQFFNFLF